MVSIKFKATIRKVGNSSHITIPKEYMGQELQLNNTYFFSIDTIEQNQPEPCSDALQSLESELNSINTKNKTVENKPLDSTTDDDLL